jgi:hypothetical protein
MTNRKAVEPEGAPRIGDDDVEGHSLTAKRATGDDDVEGHSLTAKRATGDDDVEGHTMGNPLLNQQLDRAREQDIQRSLRARQTQSEASRPHKK